MAAVGVLDAGRSLTLGDLVRDPYDRTGCLSCVPLAIQRERETLMLPGDGEAVRRGDEILLCGTHRSEMLLAATLNNAYTLHYLITGTEAPRGYFFRWLARRRQAGGSGSVDALGIGSTK